MTANGTLHVTVFGAIGISVDEPGRRLLEPSFADVAPRTDDVRPDLSGRFVQSHANEDVAQVVEGDRDGQFNRWRVVRVEPAVDQPYERLRWDSELTIGSAAVPVAQLHCIPDLHQQRPLGVTRVDVQSEPLPLRLAGTSRQEPEGVDEQRNRIRRYLGGWVQSDRYVPRMEGVLRQPETGEPGRVQLHAEEVQMQTRELIIREPFKPLHQALVGPKAVSSLLIRVSSIPGIPDWLHDLASTRLRSLEGIGHPSHEDLRGSAGEGRIAAATRADYAEAAAAVLLSGVTGVFELGGDEPFTMAQLAAEVTRQTGTPVGYRDLPIAEYRAALAGAGVPEAFAGVLADTDAAIADGALDTDSGDLRRLIGRPTTPLADAVSAALEH